MAKNIILLSDGTGNSSAAPFKTNVWRLYNYLDLASDDQIAFYDNGVGSASNMISRVLGGAFGFGLKRNVLDLYGYLCKAYRDDDDIYGFGYSRGAFTMRMTIGMVLRYGLVQYRGDTVAFERQIKSVFRANRVRLASSIGTDGKSASPIFIRWLMKGWNRVMDGWDALMGHVASSFTPVGRVRFIGVWDTVDAYGMPIEEIRSGFDKFFFPMTFRDHTLRREVEYARHALSLDDERATFHPVLWDERGEAEGATRIKQFWFAGAHGDVGGGHPDDRLAHVPLLWMMEEAKAAGLRLRSAALADVCSIADPHAPAHDSRKGLGLYYRYKPRRALRSHGDMQGPVRVHPSVVVRVTRPGISYAPVSIHGAVTSDTETPAPLNLHPELRDRALDYVWWRRLSYFIALALSLLLLASPKVPLIYWLPDGWQHWVQEAENFLVRFIGSLVNRTAALAEAWLPAFVSPWIDVFRAAPIRLLLLVSLIAATWQWSKWLESRIHLFSLAAHGQIGPPQARGFFSRYALRAAHFLRTHIICLKLYRLFFKQAVPMLIAIATSAALLWGSAHVGRAVLQSWRAAQQPIWLPPAPSNLPAGADLPAR